MGSFDESDAVLAMGDAQHQPAVFPHPDEDGPYRARTSGFHTGIVWEVYHEGSGVVVRNGLAPAVARTMAAELNDGARILGRSLPKGLGEEDTDGDELHVEHSWLAGYDPLHAPGPSASDETRERIARCNDRHTPLRARLRAACHRMTTGVEADGTVRLPREVAAFLAAFILANVDSIPVDSATCDQAFDRGWLAHG